MSLTGKFSGGWQRSYWPVGQSIKKLNYEKLDKPEIKHSLIIKTKYYDTNWSSTQINLITSFLFFSFHDPKTESLSNREQDTGRKGWNGCLWEKRGTEDIEDLPKKLTKNRCLFTMY